MFKLNVLHEDYQMDVISHSMSDGLLSAIAYLQSVLYSKWQMEGTS